VYLQKTRIVIHFLYLLDESVWDPSISELKNKSSGDLLFL